MSDDLVAIGSEYIKKYNIQKVLRDSINTLVRLLPNDPFEYLQKELETYVNKPIIQQFVLNNNNNIAILHAQSSNGAIWIESIEYQHKHVEEDNEESKENNYENIVNGMEISLDCENKIAELENIPPYVKNILSELIYRIYATIYQKPLYQVLLKQLKVVSKSYEMPCPIISLFKNTQKMKSSLRLSKVYIIPKIKSSFTEMWNIINKVRQSLSDTPIHYETGEFLISFNDVDDVISLLNKSCEAYNLVVGEDIYIGLEFNVDDCFKKKKYEFKDKKKKKSNVLLDYYKKLMETHKSIRLFVNPIAIQDEDGINILKEQNQEFAENGVMILNDHSNNETNNYETAQICKSNQSDVIKSFMENIRHLIDKNGENSVVLQPNFAGYKNGELVADLAIATKCTWIYLNSFSLTTQEGFSDRMKLIENLHNH